jgi:hypothetical protein
MNRYHKKIYFPKIQELNKFNNNINGKNWQYSKHCLENIKYRFIDIENLLIFIKGLKLQYEDIFEYYLINNKIEKVCYRIKYQKNIDIILVISNEKNLITIYINQENDNHETLQKNLYCVA